MGLDLTLLGAEAGPHPEANILGQTWKTRASKKPTLQSAKDHAEKGTVDDTEIQRTHHRERGIKGTETKEREESEILD